MPESATWLGGWAIPPKWALSILEKHFPGQTHEWLPPTAQNLAVAKPSAAYSLGASLLLLKNQDSGASLFAPFFDFKKEAGQGGKVARAQLLYVRKWLRRDPIAALNDFYQTSGIPLEISGLPYLEADLLWGIDQLLEDVPIPEIPVQAKATFGTQDALLDASTLPGLFENPTIVQGASHNLDELLTKA